MRCKHSLIYHGGFSFSMFHSFAPNLFPNFVIFYILPCPFMYYAVKCHASAELRCLCHASSQLRRCLFASFPVISRPRVAWCTATWIWFEVCYIQNWRLYITRRTLCGAFGVNLYRHCCRVFFSMCRLRIRSHLAPSLSSFPFVLEMSTTYPPETNNGVVTS